jgi:hypothetical protein
MVTANPRVRNTTTDPCNRKTREEDWENGGAITTKEEEERIVV